MKLGVSINLFNGEELLESCLENIRPYADTICVIYQNVSNFGTHKKNLRPLISELKEKGLIDHSILYVPNKEFHGLDEGTKEMIKNEGNDFNGVTYDESIYYGIFNEMNKRNLSLDYLRLIGCSHLLDMDTDEFYEHEKIKVAIKHIQEGGFDSSFCQMQTYYKDFDCVISPPETYYVPFIYKIKENSIFEQIENVDFPVHCDGKRRIKSGYSYVFDRVELEMHHFSYVRKDVDSMKSKFLNCSSRMNFTNDKINMIIKNWSNFKKGTNATFNANGNGVKFFDTKIIYPVITNIKMK